MHAFLLIGNAGWEDLAKKINAKVLPFPIEKIEDVRSLGNLIRLHFDEKTLIVCENIHEATEEALNALLKNLEEPQENIYFALTAPSPLKVLPTIVSRCQIIRSKEGVKSNVSDPEVEEFLTLSRDQKLNFIDQIKDRKKAIEFVENLINFEHRSLHKNAVKYNSRAANLEAAIETLTRLRANGNVNLQLSNLVMNYV